MHSVMELARRHRLFVVEDAAQGMGVTFGARHVGTIGDIGCMSFFADNTLTTGEGGALLVNDDAVARECTYFKNQGRLDRGTFAGFALVITLVLKFLPAVAMWEVEEQYEQKQSAAAGVSGTAMHGAMPAVPPSGGQEG